MKINTLDISGARISGKSIEIPEKIFSSKIKRGINPIKINGNTPISGQEKANNKPLNTDKDSLFIRVTNIIIFLLI